jgi:hypothetical protein
MKSSRQLPFRNSALTTFRAHSGYDFLPHFILGKVLTRIAQTQE